MRKERGLAPAIEATIIIPGLVLIIGLVIVLARITTAHHDVEAIAGNAARAASIARTVGEARQEAESMVDAGLDDYGLSCDRRRVVIDAAALRAPLTTTEAVTVTVECDVALGDVLLPGVPGSVTVRAAVKSPVDKYRER